jgi:hypothetical protein
VYQGPDSAGERCRTGKRAGKALPSFTQPRDAGFQEIVKMIASILHESQGDIPLLD